MSRKRKPKPEQANGKHQLDLFGAQTSGSLNVVSAIAPVTARQSVANRNEKTKSPEPSKARVPNANIPRSENSLLRVREAAARLGLSKSTLDKMRCEGRGPPYIKITSKVVGYDPADLDAYAAGRKRSSTRSD